MSLDLENQIVETWNIHNRINLYLLDAIPPVALNDVSASKGRTVAEQLAHLHNVRLMWLKASAPELLEGLEKIEKGTTVDKKLLARRMKESGEAMTAVLKTSIENGGKIKGFKPHITAFLGYIIAHESHHRGQVALTLKQAGFALDKKVSYGIWEWGVR